MAFVIPNVVEISSETSTKPNVVEINLLFKLNVVETNSGTSTKPNVVETRILLKE